MDYHLFAKTTELMKNVDHTNLLRIAVALVVSLLVFSTVLLFPLPIEITFLARNGGTLIGLLLIFIFVPIFRQKDWIGTLLSLIFTLVLFALPLSWLWQSGFSDGNIIGGLLPFSDANGYFTAAEQLIGGQGFGIFASRRPFFPAFLATLLALSNHNLQITLGVISGITAVACFLAAREIQKTEGAFTAVFTLIIMFYFYRTFAGKVLTEQLGLPLGALALACLWHGVSTERIKIIIFGVFILTVAMNARAGAFLILPMLILWGSWHYRQHSWFSRSFFVKATIAVILGFCLNFILLKIVGDASGQAFSNFSTVLYGLASGNKGWTQVYKDYPALTLSEQQIYKYAFALMRENPATFLQGILGAYSDFFKSEGPSAFSFLHITNTHTLRILFLFSAFGLYRCFRNRGQANRSFLLASVIGILLSVPFIPPIDSDSMRVYAATIPITAMLVSIGISEIPKTISNYIEPSIKFPVQNNGVLSSGSGPAVILSCLLLFASIAGPIFFLTFGSFSESITSLPNLDCPTESTILKMHFGKSPFINLVPDEAMAESFVPNIRIGDFRFRSNGLSGYPFLHSELLLLSEGQSIHQIALNHEDFVQQGRYGAPAFLVSSTPLQGSYPVQTCARLTDNVLLQNYRFYYADAPEEPNYVPPKHTRPTNNWVILLIGGIIVFNAYRKIIVSESTILSRTSKWKGNLLIILWMIGIIQGVLFLLHNSAGLPLSWSEVQIKPRNINHTSGFAYQTSMGTGRLGLTESFSSSGILLEDNNPLSFGNTLHSEIGELGMGRYSYWKGTLYFSSSDNSNPITNGKSYKMVLPTEFHPIFQIISYGLTATLLLIGTIKYLLGFNSLGEKLAKKHLIRNIDAKALAGKEKTHRARD